MQSSIYISSEKIQVIGYSKSGRGVSVKVHATYPLQEGAMINGTITDPAHLIEGLATLRTDYPALFKNPALIVDGSSILSKRLGAPKLNKWQYQDLIRGEFADSTEGFGEVVCDYRSLGGSSGAILACAADKNQVDSYISAFRSAGVKLKSIRIGVQALLDCVVQNPELQKKTFVLNVLEGVTMLSMIFVDSVNVFMSRTRLYGEDYEQFMQSLLENLSGLIQFNRSQKHGDITCSYYLGLSEKDISFLQEINPNNEVRMDILDIFGKSKGLPPDAHFVYLNATLGSDSVDLIRSCKTLEKYKKRQRPKQYWIAVLAGIAFVIAVFVGYIYAQTRAVDMDIEEINSYLNDKSVVSKLNELNRLSAETARYNNVISQLGVKMLAERIAVSTRVLDLINGTHSDRVTITRFDYNESSQVLRVDGNSATETDSADYVEALKKNALISGIKYTGYSYDKNGDYNFSIDITLAAREAGK